MCVCECAFVVDGELRDGEVEMNGQGARQKSSSWAYPKGVVTETERDCAAVKWSCVNGQMEWEIGQGEGESEEKRCVSRNFIYLRLA